VQLHLVELIAEISITSGYKNHGHGTWEVCEVSDCSTDWNKHFDNETITLNRELQEESLDRGSARYFYHRLWLSIHYFIWAQFNNRTSIWRPSNHQISVISRHISVTI